MIHTDQAPINNVTRNSPSIEINSHWTISGYSGIYSILLYAIYTNKFSLDYLWILRRTKLIPSYSKYYLRA